VYGTPRILADLRAGGERVSRKTVAASLRRQGLAGIGPRRFAPATTVVNLDAAVPEDRVRRRFDTGALNRCGLQTSPTCAYEGKVYCAVVLDTFSRRVVGWSIDSSQTAALVTNAPGMAIANREP
jgi:putative transposase